MKKTESKKEKKEPKKKSAAHKKAALLPKAKKELKKASKAMPTGRQAEKKIEKPEAPKVEKAHAAPKAEAHKVEKVHLEEHKAPPHPARAPEKKKPPKGVQYHGTGGRKTSNARVWLYPGTGTYLINGRPMEQYACGRQILCKMAVQPFVLTDTVGKYDVHANVFGGGYASQIGAVRHALSDALLTVNPEFRSALKKAGMLTRDSRMKERKKYGQKRARKRFQYSKR